MDRSTTMTGTADSPRRDADASTQPESLLAAQVEDLQRIHALSVRLADADKLADVLIEVLRTAAALVDARLGSVQLLQPNGTLGMIGELGFGTDILEKFSTVKLEDCSTCAVALRRRRRVVVADLRNDPDFTDIAAALRSYGAASAVSTPILDKRGNVLAMFSLYWLEVHQPDERELRALDLCAEIAGRHVERSIATQALSERDQRHIFLMRELAHRGKNLLAVIQAIASRTLRGDRTLDEAREAFIGRLGALARTYDTLTDDAAVSVQFTTIITSALELYSDKITASGPDISVSAGKAQTLALAVHELATNSAKYGALSTPSGRVEVCWRVLEGDNLSFAWSELGGPAPVPSASKGFGSTILTSVVGSELQCSPRVEFLPGGLEYRFQCAMKALRGAA